MPAKQHEQDVAAPRPRQQRPVCKHRIHSPLAATRCPAPCRVGQRGLSRELDSFTHLAVMRSSTFYSHVMVEATWGTVTRCLSLPARVVSAEGSCEAFTSSPASTTDEAPLPPGCQWRLSGEHGLPPPGRSKVASHFLCQSRVRGSQLSWIKPCPSSFIS